MMDFYKGIPIIDVDAALQIGNAQADMLYPKGATFGYDPSTHVKGMHAAPSEMETIPESAWDAWFDEQEAKQSSLEHIYLSGPNGGPAFANLNQSRDSYCWGYSTGHAIMLRRLADGQPYVRLNPHGPCAIIMKGQNEGGWSGLSAKFAREHGYPEEGTGPGQWPFNSRDLRHDTPALRASMARYKVVEEWTDLSSIYNPKMTELQRATGLMQNCPEPSDFNFWGHAVCAIRWVRLERGSWGRLILNSWEGWGRHGLGVLRGSQATPDGVLSIRTVKAAA